MDINSFFQGGVIIGLATYIAVQLKSVPKWIWDRIENRFIYRVNISQEDEFYQYFENWLLANHSEKYRNVEANLGFKKSNEERIRNIDDYVNIDQKIIYSQFEDFFIIKANKRRIYISKGREKFENASSLSSAYFNRFKLSALFGRKAIEKLLEDVLRFNIELQNKNRTINVFTNNSWGEWYKVQDLKAKDISRIIIDPVIKDELIKDINDFETSEAWYKERAITFKRGYLFTGAPGNGKTSLSLSLAQKFKRDIYFLTNDLDNSSCLNRAMQNLKPNSMLVFEDVDCLVNLREVNNGNKSESKGFNFSTLLNCLDGSFSKENVIIVMTTNHPEKLDPALIRSGRIDKKYQINNPNKELIEQYLEIFYGSPVQLGFEVVGNHHLSMSAVQDACITNKNNPKKALIAIERAMYGLKPIEV